VVGCRGNIGINSAERCWSRTEALFGAVSSERIFGGEVSLHH